MTNRWSAKVTTDVNMGISKGRRPTGKGSRQTTYQNLFRTRRDEMLSHSRAMMAVFSNANMRSHGETTQGAKWYLSHTQKGVSTNHNHFQYFSRVLRERGISDSMPMVVEFVGHLMGLMDFNQVLGDDVISKKEAAKQVAKVAEEEEEFCEWGAGAAAAAPVTWAVEEEPSFSDEEDEME